MLCLNVLTDPPSWNKTRKGICYLTIAHILVPVTCLARTPDLWAYLFVSSRLLAESFRCLNMQLESKHLGQLRLPGMKNEAVVHEQISHKEEALLKLFYIRKAGGLMWKSMAGRSFSPCFRQPPCRISIARRCCTYQCASFWAFCVGRKRTIPKV